MGTIYNAGKSRQRHLEAAGHVVSTVREKRVTNTLRSYFLLFMQLRTAHQGMLS